MERNRNIGCILVLGLVVLAGASGPSSACGWWGDGEDDLSTDAEVIVPGTTSVDLNPSNPAAMVKLSQAYRRGTGVSKNPQRALFWAKKAAKAGHAGAMNDLGQMYEKGIAGKVDAKAAVHWYRLAAKKGLASAQHSLAGMLREGTGVDPDPKAANIWLRRSAKQGHVSATAELATRIWSGEIAAQEANEGCFWWLVALKEGFDASPQRCRDEEADLSDSEFQRIRKKAASWLPIPENPGKTTKKEGS